VLWVPASAGMTVSNTPVCADFASAIHNKFLVLT
jgi:hypothetical protein